MRSVGRAGLVCGLLLASGCGDEAGNGQVLTADDATLVTCGDASWAPSTMSEGIPGVLTDVEATAAFQGILDDPGTGEEASLSLFPDGVDVDWRVLAEDGDELTIGLGEWTDRGPARRNAWVLGLRREGDGWSTGGWGDCRLAPVLDDGSAWVRVDGYRSTGARSLEVDVTEMQCASGREPDEYLHTPTVVETESTVTLFWTSTAAEGAQNCPGAPPTTRLVELDDALGTRKVLDGSTYPPRLVASD